MGDDWFESINGYLLKQRCFLPDGITTRFWDDKVDLFGSKRNLKDYLSTKALSH
jgi:hypothetical protein